jgi:hypothetical protein
MERSEMLAIERRRAPALEAAPPVSVCPRCGTDGEWDPLDPALSPDGKADVRCRGCDTEWTESVDSVALDLVRRRGWNG